MANEKNNPNLQNADSEKTGASDSKSSSEPSKSGFDPKSLRFLKPVIPTGVIAAVIIGSLAGYQAPTYTAKAASASSGSTSGKTSKEKDASSSKKNTAKTSAKKLPAVSTVSESSDSSSSASAAASSSGSGTAGKLSAVSDKNTTYKDGTYTGSARGFGGPITVRVTIRNGKISSVVITSHEKETPTFFNKAKVLAKTIQSRQTTNVDAVSGATYSSNGIINAVRNALAKAGGSSSAAASKKTAASSGRKNTTGNGNTASNAGRKAPKRKNKTANANTTYKDGTYMGSGTGFGGPVKVKVRIKNGKIRSVTVTDHSGETEPYYSNASVLTKTIVEKQSTSVDTVSGATFSSNGILDAVDEALQKAAVKNSRNTSTKKNSGEKKNNENSNTDEKKNNGNSDQNNDKKSSDDTTEKKEDTGTVYNPGTYTVSSMVYPDEEEDFTEYEISLDVTVANDKVTAVSNVRNLDNNGVNGSYLKMAANGVGSRKGVISQITAAGNADNIDAVSGATCSSEGIISGVKSALEQAKKTDSSNTDSSSDTDSSTAGNTDSGSENTADATGSSGSQAANMTDSSGNETNFSGSETTSSENGAGNVETATLTAASVHASVFRFIVPGSREINTSRMYRLS